MTDKYNYHNPSHEHSSHPVPSDVLSFFFVGSICFPCLIMNFIEIWPTRTNGNTLDKTTAEDTILPLYLFWGLGPSSKILNINNVLQDKKRQELTLEKVRQRVNEESRMLSFLSPKLQRQRTAAAVNRAKNLNTWTRSFAFQNLISELMIDALLYQSISI